MIAKTKYIAKKPDAQGYIDYSEAENAVWKTLYNRQYPLVAERAHPAYLKGLDVLGLNNQRIPQCVEVSRILQATTGWSVAPVEALISFESFFQMLANRQFPAASFIRVPEELDYLQEPDIFHELFGHCPMLTDQTFADFTHNYGKLGLKASTKERVYLARLYWFTVEFGLIQTQEELKIYGGGILSSYGETLYALDSSIPERKPFDILTMLRTPYRYDIMQTVYFVLNGLDDLYQVMQQDLMALVKQASELGMLPASFPPKDGGGKEPEVRSC
ncbi:MAG TPA: phenylalanine 4-monooxygenase [Gammaproteobacteria bacterium]|nr:phenylalanine 4-monooxygenase [Gammaproteobacteria bacterium]